VSVRPGIGYSIEAESKMEADQPGKLQQQQYFQVSR
jgi:hypothetical protein